MSLRLHVFARVLAAVAPAALALYVPAGTMAGPAVVRADVVEWIAPTPAANTVLKARADSRLTIVLAARTGAGSAAVQIRGVQLPGGTVRTLDGNPARATFTWRPGAGAVGEHLVTFTASSPVLGIGAAAPRALVIRVTKAAWPKRISLSDADAETYRWAFVTRRTAVRRGPSRSSRSFSTLMRKTPEYFPNLVQTLNEVRHRNGDTWVQVRLAILPNSSTGWVRRRALGRYRTVRTRLFISRRALRATLFRRGKPIFRTIVGVGQSRWPTPRGDFYVREVLTGYNMPVYGPVAIGISARSNVLTDWPGGGFIGIHGTNAPGLLPGYVSHGCVRMRNAAIVRLARLMPLGTPVQIR